MLTYGVPIIAFWNLESGKGYYYPKNTLNRIKGDQSCHGYVISKLLNCDCGGFARAYKLYNLQYTDGKILREDGEPVDQGYLYEIKR